MAERNGSVSTYRDGRMEFMRLAAQRQKLLAGGRAVDGLGKAPLAKRQGLIAADDDAVARHRGDRAGFFARQGQRDLARVSGDALLDRALIEMRRTRLNR